MIDDWWWGFFFLFALEKGIGMREQKEEQTKRGPDWLLLLPVLFFKWSNSL